MVKVGIVGGKGYVSAELMRILINHQGAVVEGVSSRSNAGEPLYKQMPGLRGLTDLAFTGESPGELAQRCDVVFMATPHGVSVKVADEVLGAGAKLIDHSGDFRFSDISVYEEWYKSGHGRPDLQEKAVYGLPELYREKIRTAGILGVPGCYPTSVILPTAPFLAVGYADPRDIIADSKSGVSGAGNTPGPGFHYPSSTENFRAYGIATHRHTPEIEQELGFAAGSKALVSFTPHLVPMSRGILSTIYIRPLPGKAGMSTKDAIGLLEERYADETFIRVLGEDELPQTKAVASSNFVEMTARVDDRTNRIILICALDNMVKGAAGAAIQCMNLMFGLDEAMGLKMPGLMP